jgi:hypothetical protein
MKMKHLKKTSRAVRVAAGTIAAAAALAVAAPAGAQTIDSANPRSTVKRTLGCGGMTAELTVERQGSSVWAHVSGYNFANNGRTSGNTKLKVDVPRGSTGWADFGSAIQDGQWHWGNFASQSVTGAQGTVSATIEFVYDKSFASDPKCTDTVYGI